MFIDILSACIIMMIWLTLETRACWSILKIQSRVFYYINVVLSVVLAISFVFDHSGQSVFQDGVLFALMATLIMSLLSHYFQFMYQWRRG